ncbi:MAG: lytic transglycosylase domain-containing protein [Gemmatimonadota bacterium]
MVEANEREQSADLTRRAYVSPAVSGPDRVTNLLFQWDTRNFGAGRRHLTAWWLRSRRSATAVIVASVLVFAGAAVAHEPELATANLTLEQQLEKAEIALNARKGELELAHLELKRLQEIVGQSKHHRIPADLAGAIYDIALSEGVDPALAFSLVRVESGFTRRAVSSAGAVGFTQVMPSTAFWLQPGLRYNDLFERETNLRLGFRYLRMMLEQYDGNLHLALLAYNRGPGRVDEILGDGGDPSNGYSANVTGGALRRNGD